MQRSASRHEHAVGGTVPMVLPATYHIHVSEYEGPRGTPSLPECLLDPPLLPAREQNTHVPNATHLDRRLSPVEVQFVRVQGAPMTRNEALPNESYGRFQGIDSFPAEPSSDEAADVRISFGIVHLFRTIPAPSEDPEVDDAPPGNEEAIGTILCMLAVPSSLTTSSLLDFIEPALEAVRNVRVIRYVSFLTQPRRAEYEHGPATISRGA